MRTNYYLAIFFLASFGKLYCQNLETQTKKIDTSGYNYSYWNALADKKHLNPLERAEFIEGCKALYHREQEEGHLHLEPEELVWIPQTTSKGYGSNNVHAGPCTNIDFEANNTSGWVQWNGFNPLFNPGVGCCTLTNVIDQAIMAGGNDPYGGFPRVFPGGGNFSLRLGSNTFGGRADRIEQTFFVTPANANFTYRYAVVLNDAGHTANQQPRFTIEMIDTLGNPVPCAFYDVRAGGNIPGFLTSTLTGGSPAVGVVYKPWTSVAMDLTPNIGQNVTIRFTVYDCSPSGHFAYAYIDGFCTNFQTSIADTTCPNIPYTMCGPVGFGSYRWDGPGVVNNTNSCIAVSAPGVYTCQTILVPGCPGPSFVHTLTNLPSPVLTFTALTNTCSPQYSFTSTSSISAGSIASYSYTFGDNSGTFLQSPVHNYPGPGAYNVEFKAISDRGCADSVTQTVYVYPPPQVSFSPPSHCINTLVQFTNTSNVPPIVGVPPGTVNSFTWNFGNGFTSNLQNPTSTFTSSGTFTVALSVTSDQGCVVSATQTLGIFPPPQLDFLADPLCDVNGTTFTPLTNTAIAYGSIATYFWDFGDGNTSNLQSPTHVYNGPGSYVIKYRGTSNHSCVDSVTKTLVISPTPTIAFSTFSVDACTPSFTFQNTSNISAGSISYTWNFGGGNTTTATNPNYNFPGIGNYTVQLIGMSNMGCADTAVQQISIYPLPVVTVSVPASCESAIFTVTTTAVSGSVTSYNWNFGDPSSGPANTSTLQNPTHIYPTVNNYTISLVIVSNQNCISTYSSQIFVRPNPVSNLNFFPPDACTPTYTFVNNSGFNPSPPPSGNSIVSYSWNFSGLGVSTATSPVYTFPGPGVYTVSLLSVTNHNCSDVDTKTVTIHPYPTASITAANACLNVPASYIGTFGITQLPQPGSVVSYTWNFGDGIFDNNLNTTHNYLTQGTYLVSFSVTSNQGCVSTATQNLVIHPLPNLTFNFINPCAGTPVTFSNVTTVFPPGGSITGYRWDFENDGITNSTQTIPTHTYPAFGTYSVELFARTNNNCIDSLTKVITVHDLPTPVITSSNVCFGINAPFSASLSLPGNQAQITNYSWNVGDGSPAVTSQNGLHAYSAPGIYTLQLTTTNNYNCTASTSSLMTVHQIPQVDFITNPVCLTSATNFTNTSFIGSPDQIIRWRWNFGNGLVQSLSRDTSYIFTGIGTYVVTLEATSNQLCNATKTNTIIVHGNPRAEFSNAVVCVGDKVSFTNLSSSSDGTIISHAWDFNGDSNTDVDQQIPNFTYGAPGLFPVTLRVTTNYGCSSAFTKSIHANPKAVPAFTSDVRSGCPELCVNFKNLSSISDTSANFSSMWDFGDGGSQSPFPNPQRCFGDGRYTISLTLRTDSGCVSTLTNTSYLTVHPNPIAAFNVFPPDVDEDDPTINVVNASSSDVTSVRYFMSDGSNFGTANFTHVVKNLNKKEKPMIVQIVQNQFGCIDTLYKVLEIKPAFAIYVPNVFTPNGDGNNDGFQAKGVGILKFAMQIYDRWGHIVWETNTMNDAWDGTVKSEFDAPKQDVYTWKAQVVDILNKSHTLVGHVSIIR